MMDDTIGFIFIPGVTVLVIGILYWHFSRSWSLLRQWTADNGYELLRAEYRTFRRGPFFWSTSRGQTVYFVEVRDRRGHTRTGWVRCGSWWLGLMSDKVEVRWENS
jgi:hypothetical protein